MHYLSTKKGTRYQSLTTENWPFQCSQLTVGRIVIVFVALKQNILITITSWQPLIFILSPSSGQSLAHFSSSLLTGGLALTLVKRYKLRDTCQNVFSFTFSFVSSNTGLIFARMSLKVLLDVCLRLQLGIGLITIFPLPGSY